MNISELLHKRYATKSFDTNKKLSEEQILQLEELLQMSPSSVNIQPWHFIVATTDEGKNRIAKGTEAFAVNTPKILEASAVVVFATKTDLSDEYIQTLVDQEDKDGRFSNPQFKEQLHQVMSFFVGAHRNDFKDAKTWAEKQVYLNVGHFLMGATALGFDTLAMEGIDFSAIDKEFGLVEKGFTSTVVVSVGYHNPADFNKDLPKSRLPKDQIIDRI
ncbi:MAG: oxygen-insensitive NAD(P)H nitroreductase [Brevinema sp.]